MTRSEITREFIRLAGELEKRGADRATVIEALLLAGISAGRKLAGQQHMIGVLEGLARDLKASPAKPTGLN